ncbi:MAG: nucleotidyltransferase domain-containing protein [Candidatus Marsarchaeota archaeon]|nr:nucleotidyltransferase domain-containing protein [Candidatus Marsarchaeota archaeon]
MKNRQLVKRIKSCLADKQYTIAIFNNGSTIAGTETNDSDIDFTVLVKSKADVNRALKLLKTSIKFVFIDHGVPTFKFNGKRIGVTIWEKRKADYFVNSLYKSSKDLLEWQGTVQHKIVEAIPVYDPENLLKLYQNRVSKYPQRIQSVVYSNAINTLDSIYNGWAFRNEFHFAFELPTIIETICLAIYSKNRRLYMRPFKRAHKDLKELKPNIEKEMYFLVSGTNSKKNRDSKKRVLKKIINKLS